MGKMREMVVVYRTIFRGRRSLYTAHYSMKNRIVLYLDGVLGRLVSLLHTHAHLIARSHFFLPEINISSQGF